MYTQGKFGIEYTPPPPKPDHLWVSRTLLVVGLVIVALITRAIWRRITTPQETEQTVVLADAVASDELRVTSDECRNSPSLNTQHSSLNTSQSIPLANRPLKVRNLLLRLAEAERTRDLEMAVTTLEQLRATPGAADLDDPLARRLGTLNMRRLFELKSGQWTIPVTVKRGDLATRIAYEHGSTLASFAKLNGDIPLDKLQVGQKLVVMNHPRFQLVVTRRTRIADLSLNGKFFKRYDLTDDVTSSVGSFTTPDRFRAFCAEKGIAFRPLDRAELEMLIPKGAAVFIKDV